SSSSAMTMGRLACWLSASTSCMREASAGSAGLVQWRQTWSAMIRALASSGAERSSANSASSAALLGSVWARAGGATAIAQSGPARAMMNRKRASQWRMMGQSEPFSPGPQAAWRLVGGVRRAPAGLDRAAQPAQPGGEEQQDAAVVMYAEEQRRQH